MRYTDFTVHDILLLLQGAGVSVRTTHTLVARLATLGVDVASVLDSVGLRGEDVRDPDGRLSHGRAAALWERAGEVSGDPLLSLRALEVIRPLHIELRSNGPSELMTSYLMNGAVQDYGAPIPNRITKFKTHHVIFWESGETSLMNNGPPFNDGSSFPGEWLTERHGNSTRVMGGGAKGSGGASIACFDGHVEWMSHRDYDVEKNKDPARYGEGSNRFWCAPNLSGGGFRISPN